MSRCNTIWSVLLEYDTVKFVTVKNKKVGLVHRLIQLTILGYIIGYVLIFKKGYQEFSDIRSAVTTKVKGVIYTNYSDDEFLPDIKDKSLYRRIWDITDLVIPPSENNAFFIATNVVITPNQTLSQCPEDVSIANATCYPNKNETGCVAGTPFLLGDGVSTGECVPYDDKNETFTCEIYGWCPLELDAGPLNDTSRALLVDTGNFTVLIKNFIDFPLYHVARRNILNTQDKNFLSNCHYDPVENPLCPVFLLKDIVMHAGFDYNKMAVKGGVMAVVIDWDCDLDYSAERCIPTYSFKRLDNPDAVLAKGWNFRYANYFSDSSRTLYKLYGIDVVILVNGKGGRFSIIPLLLNIGSGLGLLALATVISDLCILYIVKKRDLYKSKKYSEVQTEYDSFRNPEYESDLRRRAAYGSSEPVIEDNR